jgi:plastocyanin
MNRSNALRGRSLWAATILALALAAVFLAGMAVMAVAMSGHMGGGMMLGSRAASQTPVVSDDENVTIDIEDYDYFPRDLTINAGAAVTWLNHDGVPHDATDDSRAWTTRTLGENDSETVVFDTPGTYPYYCTIHPSMTATIIVR